MPSTSANAVSRPTHALGPLLREWRASRGMSQVDLAVRAGFSARHVSFIETGRTHPSRQALLDLAEALDMPLRERNQLLETGGYAHVYSHTPLAAGELSPVRGVLQFILEKHAPYAAIVLDRYGNCLMGNAASDRLLRLLVDPSLITEHANHWRMVFHPLGARRWIVNWDEAGKDLFARAERDLGSFEDFTAAALLAELRGYGPPLPQRPPAALLKPGALLLPVHIRNENVEVRLF